jgi:transcription initiation factor TFIID subunit TAF12
MNTKRPRNNRNNQRRGSGQGGGGGRPNSFDSNGPDVKIRGNPSQIFEKYQSLARDANTSGDRVMAENYLQHAEHYYRLSSEINAQRQQQQQQQQQRQQNQRQDSQEEQNQPDNAVAADAEEAPQEAVVEKKEPVVEVPDDPASEPQPVIE